MKYAEQLHKTVRRISREVKVGTVGIGGSNPIRIQSMTTTPTADVNATVDQIKKLADHGCEIARVTVQGIKEAKACEQIKSKLIQDGYNIPVVADIHFFPAAAMSVADFVDKVRINPGNFVDKRAVFKTLSYTKESYNQELEKIEEKFTPLVLKCKKQGVAIRIGTNHGSLSDRIMNYYGDTPLGMVESAIEYTLVCRKCDFHDIIYSMKASNPQIMVQAYRLLCQRMYEMGWDYPLHLGVTEAGEGIEGRIKSAIGIGSLLLDGLGDTIRVSLTEDPWKEIDPCKRLVAITKNASKLKPFQETFRNPIEYKKFSSIRPSFLKKQGVVALDITHTDIEEIKDLKEVDFAISRSNVSFEQIKYFQENAVALYAPNSVHRLTCLNEVKTDFFSFGFKLDEIMLTGIDDENKWEALLKQKPSIVIFEPKFSLVHEARQFFQWLSEKQFFPTVVFVCEENLYKTSAHIGSLLCDGLGSGILAESKYLEMGLCIMQGSRIRMIQTEFISCPSCGRTLFDLQEVSKKIREKTKHLPGLKIAIMGCIVNGPGEMADADFGYVGSKPGKIDLYVGKTCVEKNIDMAIADEKLIDLIKSHGMWKDPQKQDNKTLV